MPNPEQQRAPSRRTDPGYAMAGLLVAIAVMGIMLSIIMPTWRTWATREKEAELIFRGEQYMRAIELYQRRFPGAYPAELDILIDQRFLRKAYTDPITGGEFNLLTQGSLSATPIQAPPGSGTPGVPQPQPFGNIAPAGQNNGGVAPPDTFTAAAAGANREAVGAGIVGVVSSSTESSMRSYNERDRYDEWLFVYLAQATQPGAGTGVPGQAGGVQPGLGGIGNVAGQRDRGARGRGGQEPGRAGRQPGGATPRTEGPGATRTIPNRPGVSIGGPPPR